MNFLDLVNSLRVEVGASGQDLQNFGNLPNSMKRLQNWIVQSNIEIQNSQPQWNFLRGFFYAPTTGAYLIPANANLALVNALSPSIGTWDFPTIRIYPGAVATPPAQYVNRISFDEMLMLNALSTTLGKPTLVAEDPADRKLQFWPTPDIPYYVSGSAWMKPVALINEQSIPVVPDEFQMVIVYRAMQKYAGYESAPEVMARANTEYSRLYNELCIRALPQVQFGYPLA